MHAIKYCNDVQGLSYWQTQDLKKQQEVILAEINGRKTRRQKKRKFLTYQEETTKKAVEVSGNLEELKNESTKKKKRKTKKKKNKKTKKKVKSTQISKPQISKPQISKPQNPKLRFNLQCEKMERTFDSDTLGLTIIKKDGKVTFSKDSGLIDKQIVNINGWDCTGSYDTPEFYTKMKQRPLQLHFQLYDDVQLRFGEYYLKFKKDIANSDCIDIFLILDECSVEIQKIESYKKDEKGVPKCSISEMNEIYWSIEKVYEKMKIKK